MTDRRALVATVLVTHAVTAAVLLAAITGLIESVHVTLASYEDTVLATLDRFIASLEP